MRFLPGALPWKYNPTFLKMLQAAGVANWDSVLDARAIDSYDGSAQTWFDLTANNADFFLGTTIASQATDPVFNGVAGGMSVNEHFEFVSSDQFRESADHAAFNQYHRAGNAFSLVGVVFVPAGGGSFIFRNATGVPRGIQATFANSLIRLQIFRTNGAGVGPTAQYDSSLVLDTDSWNVFGVGWDDAGGTDNLLFFANGDQDEQTQTLAAGSDGDPNNATDIVAANDYLFAAFGACSQKLTPAQAANIHTRVQRAWPVP